MKHLALAVLGKDVSQSVSPEIHAFILGKFGICCTYDKISLAAEEFPARIGEIFARYDGFNVTIPFKERVLPYLGKTEGDALAFGAVNTVCTRERVGYNTDGFGFALMLENAGVEIEGKRVLILGAGGAGRSCLKTAADLGADVAVYERDEARLLAVHRQLGGFRPLTEIPAEPFDVVVNCTGIGMHETVGQTPTVRFAGIGAAPVGEAFLRLCGTAVDLIYVPQTTEFLRLARSLGKRTVSGGAMLFYQAYGSDCIFTRRTPDAREAKRLWEEFQKEEL